VVKGKKQVTGIFFHHLMAEGDWPVIGNKFKDFPGALGDCLNLPNVRLFTPEPVQEGLLLKVHTPALLRRVKDAWYYAGAGVPSEGAWLAPEGWRRVP
jgi:hypothetical protein